MNKNTKEIFQKDYEKKFYERSNEGTNKRWF